MSDVLWRELLLPGLLSDCFFYPAFHFLCTSGIAQVTDECSVPEHDLTQ